MKILTFMFYVWAIPAMLWEIMNMYHPEKIENLKSANKGLKFDECSSEYKSMCFLNLGYTVWMCIGFMSSQWILFILMLIVGLIAYPVNVTVRRINAFFTLVILLLLLVNKYQLRLDLKSLILNYL